jgi:hypothetical protein
MDWPGRPVRRLHEHVRAERQFQLRLQGTGRRHLRLGVRHLCQRDPQQPAEPAFTPDRAVRASERHVAAHSHQPRVNGGAHPARRRFGFTDAAALVGAHPAPVVQALGRRRPRLVRPGLRLCAGRQRPVADRARTTADPRCLCTAASATAKHRRRGQGRPALPANLRAARRACPPPRSRCQACCLPHGPTAATEATPCTPTPRTASPRSAAPHARHCSALARRRTRRPSSSRPGCPTPPT